jgi:hypothetical protein
MYLTEMGKLHVLGNGKIHVLGNGKITCLWKWRNMSPGK